MTLSFCLPARALTSLGEEPMGISIRVSSLKDDGSVEVTVDGETEGVETMLARIKQFVTQNR
jgi:hypothetical protein